jgi:hypothetical protein
MSRISIIQVVTLLLMVGTLSLGSYNLGRTHERLHQTGAYQKGMEQGIKLGCSARGRVL